MLDRADPIHMSDMKNTQYHNFIGYSMQKNIFEILGNI